MDEIPKFLDKHIFKRIFNIGAVSKLNKEERMPYEASLKAKWDTQNAFDYALQIILNFVICVTLTYIPRFGNYCRLKV